MESKGHFLKVFIATAIAGASVLWQPAIAVAETHNYNIRLASVLVRNTRSRHNDSVYATIAGFISGTKIGEARWDGTCNDNSCSPGRDFNNGLHVFGGAVSFDTGEIDDATTVRTVVEIVNSGHSDVAATAASTTVAALGSALCTTIVGCAAGAVGAAMTSWLFTDCDGPLALASFDITGAQLRARAPSQPLNDYARFGGLDIPGTDGNTFYGTDSPSGCGSNSNYRVDLAVYRHD
jgi:hypothetical protein